MYSYFNQQLSQSYSSKIKSYKPSLLINYKLSKKLSVKSNFNTETIYLSTKENFETPLLDKKYDFSNFSSGFRFQSNSNSIDLSFEKTSNMPDVENLRSFENNTSPTHQITGNPNLKPEKNYTISANYMNFKLGKRKAFAYANIYAVKTNQRTVSNTILNSDLTSNTTYTNLDNNLYLGMHSSYDVKFKIDSIRSFSVNPSLGVSYNSGKLLRNSSVYNTKSNSLSPSLKLQFNWDKKFDVSLRYFHQFSQSKFSIPSIKTQNIQNRNISFESSINLTKNLIWNNSLVLNKQSQLTSNTSPGYNFWNSTLDYMMMDGNLTASVKAFDLLNQNTSISQTTNTDYISSKQQKVLQQYFLLSLTWRFNTLGNKS